MRKFKLTKSLGMILLGIWLIVTGLIPLLNLSFEGLSLIMSILAITAGVLVMFGR
jgi:polyferredoxin